MKAHALRFVLLSFALVATIAAFSACKKAIAKDPRLDETGHFNGNWPPKATTLAAAVAEVEANIGPGMKRPSGLVEWTAQVDAEHCGRIRLKDEGGKLVADSERLKEAHPDFAACMSGK